MLIRKPAAIPYSQVTPKEIYLNRRRFLSTAIAAGLVGPYSANAAKIPNFTKTSYNVGKEKISPLDVIAGYNNYYEFGTGKEDPSQPGNAPAWKTPYLTDPRWKVQIMGEVMQPKTLDLDQIMKLAPLEERIYRHRCVERWSIVVPWIGIPLSTLLKQVQPLGSAKYVQFESSYQPEVMEGGGGLGIFGGDRD